MKFIGIVLVIGLGIVSSFLGVRPLTPRKITKFNQYSRLRPKLSLNSVPISIDHSVLPPLIHPNYRTFGVTAVLAACMYKLIQSNVDLNFEVSTAAFPSVALRHITDKIFESVIAQLPRVCSINWIPQCMRVSHYPQDSSLAQWRVCRVNKVENMSEEYSKYSFDIPSSKGAVHLDVAQELMLCSVDAKGKALKKGFFLASPPNSKGGFSIVCNKGGGRLSGDMSGVPEVLQYVEAGDELAVKEGARRLVMPPQGEERGKGEGEGEEEGVTALSVFTSGLGIVPTLQLLREVLGDARSSVQQVEVLWINDAKKDFVLNSEMQELERRHEYQLRVTRVVDREAGNLDTQFNEQLRGAVSPHQAGNLAVVMAEGVVAAKANQLFATLGYSTDAVAKLSQE